MEAEEGAALLPKWGMVVDTGEATLGGGAFVILGTEIVKNPSPKAAHCRHGKI
jgi:hypothetical protein